MSSVRPPQVRRRDRRHPLGERASASCPRSTSRATSSRRSCCAIMSAVPWTGRVNIEFEADRHALRLERRRDRSPARRRYSRSVPAARSAADRGADDAARCGWSRRRAPAPRARAPSTCGCERPAVVDHVVRPEPRHPGARTRAARRWRRPVSWVSRRASCTAIDPTPPAPPTIEEDRRRAGTGRRISSRSNSISQAVIAVSGSAAASAQSADCRLAARRSARRRGGTPRWSPAGRPTRHRRPHRPAGRASPPGRPRSTTPAASKPSTFQPPGSGSARRRTLVSTGFDRDRPHPDQEVAPGRLGHRQLDVDERLRIVGAEANADSRPRAWGSSVVAASAGSLAPPANRAGPHACGARPIAGT